MKKLDQKSVWLFFLNFIAPVVMLLIIFGAVVFADSVTNNIFPPNELENTEGTQTLYSIIHWVWIILPIWIITAFLWAKLTYRFYRYELTEKSFRKESGVISKSYVSIPYDRIQNVDIYRSLPARILGLSDLQIQTAGASAVVSGSHMIGISAEGRLPGLSKEVAEELRNELIDRIHRSKLGL